LRDADSCLVEDEVNATHDFLHNSVITDITVHNRYEITPRAGQYIVSMAPAEIIEHNDLLAAKCLRLPQQKIKNM
jgi:hypothetical protein